MKKYIEFFELIIEINIHFIFHMEREIEFIPVKKEELVKFAKDMADSFSVATQVYNLPEN